MPKSKTDQCKIKVNCLCVYVDYCLFKYHKPCLHLYYDLGIEKSVKLLREFIHSFKPRILNIAGSRLSEESEIVFFVKDVLEKGINT